MCSIIPLLIFGSSTSGSASVVLGWNWLVLPTAILRVETFGSEFADLFRFVVIVFPPS